MNQNFFNFSGSTLLYYEELIGEEYRASIHWGSAAQNSRWDDWWKALDTTCLPFSSRNKPQSRHFGIVVISCDRNWKGAESMNRRLPWHTMRGQEEALKKFFGMGNWEYLRESVGLPRSFAFKKEPIPIITSEINCDRSIIVFLNMSDYLALSTCSKTSLAFCRANETLKMTTDIKKGGMPYFARAGLKARKELRAAPNGCKAKIKQYEYWWYCSTAKLINILWHRWEDFLQDEKDTQWAVRQNRCLWYEETNSDSETDIGEKLYLLEIEDECDY